MGGERNQWLETKLVKAQTLFFSLQSSILYSYPKKKYLICYLIIVKKKLFV